MSHQQDSLVLRTERKSAIIADEPGCGKTGKHKLEIVVLTLFIATAYGCLVQTTYANRLGTHVICCPNSVVPVWISEAAKLYPNLKNIVKFQGTEADRDRAFEQILRLYGNCIILLPYSQAGNFIKLMGLLTARFDSFTLDECHLIKNMKTNRHKYCLLIAQASACIAGLTGISLQIPAVAYYCNRYFADVHLRRFTGGI